MKRRPILLAGAGLLVLLFLGLPIWAVLAGAQGPGGGADAYATLVTSPRVWRFLLNSVLFSAAAAAGQVLLATLAGYSLARLPLPGRRPIFALLIVLLIVPAIGLVLPRFLLLQVLGWNDTLGGLISTQLVSAWGIFLMRQAFLDLPVEVEDAARLDGADGWTIFREIAVPAVRPAIAVVALLAAVDAGKAYLWPLVAARPLRSQPLEVGVASLHGLYYSNWPYQMAAAGTLALPLVFLFLLARRHFIRGIEQAEFR